MNPELEDLYQEVILDHSRRPRNFGHLSDAAVRVHGDNPACGDEIDLDVKFGEDGSLQDLKFSGHGCAISQASASMMTAKLKGKARAEVVETMRAFHDLVAGEGTEAGGDGLLVPDVREHRSIDRNLRAFGDGNQERRLSHQRQQARRL